MNAVITYHSVGTQNNTFLQDLPSVDENTFRNQINQLLSRYNIVSSEDFFKFESNNNILLTFDDGLKCHYEVAAKILSELSIPAVFFVSSGPLLFKEMLLVHKLQILVSESKKNIKIFNELFNFATQECTSMKKLIEENPNIHIHQYESNDYNFIKKSFQIFINKKTASDFLDKLLETYCDSSEKIFDDMYLTKNDCKSLLQSGFEIGGHSRSHPWMEYLDEDKIADEILYDSKMFEELDIQKKLYCYPYGSYSKKVIDVLKKEGFEYGFTIKSGDFEKSTNDLFEIKRYDVNEFFSKII